MKRKVENVEIKMILFLIFCLINLSSYSQELPDSEVFINHYFLNKMKIDSMSHYWVYEQSLTNINIAQISMGALRNNEKRKFDIENPKEYYQRFPIDDILDTDNLNMMKKQLKNLDSKGWDNNKLIENISLLRSNKDIEKISHKLLKNKRFADKVKCVYEFSLPVFSKDKTVAMIFVNSYCSRAQGGDIIIFQKDSNQWEIKCFYERWIALYD